MNGLCGQHANAATIHRAILFGLLLSLALITGCFDSEDIDRRMIVSPIGIDARPGGYILVSFRMPVIAPVGVQHRGQTNEKPYILRSALAKGVYPALIALQNRDEHSIFVGQCRSVIFGEAIAKRGLRPILDFFNRMPTFPPSAFVAIARVAALDILKIDWPEQEGHDQNIRWFFSNQANQMLGIKKWQLFQNINDPLQDPAVPLVTPSDKYTSMKLLGMAIFRKDRMVGELNEEETRLFGMIKQPQMENRITIPSPSSVPVTFQVAKGKKKLKVAYRNHPVFRWEININAFLGELGGYPMPLNTPELHRLEHKCAVYLTRKYHGLFRKLQALQSDPLELGNNFRIQQPKHFSLSKWPDDYRQAEFKVKVKVFIERLGVMK